MTELRCPRCGDRYGPPARFCIRDGYALVPVQEGEITPREVRARQIWEPGAAFVEPASRLTGRVLDDRYELRQQVGAGGMAFVYRALDRERGREVAVKVLASHLSADAESVARLQREAKLTMRLNHPNVCHVLAVGSDRGLHYLVMPLLAGEPLNLRQERQGTFSVAEVVPILKQLAAGLQHAHDHGVFHRDLKPENVMLVPAESGERAVIMDFGLAKPAEPLSEADRLTATGVVLGTPEFMSPEQVRAHPLDGRSDQYALAMLAFELLTGELPIAGGTSQATMLRRLTDLPVPLRAKRPDAPAALEAVLARALARDREDRFPDLHAFAAALDEVRGVPQAPGKESER